MSTLAADMFVGRERFATLLLMRLTETVILWLSNDQSFWDDIEDGPRPLGTLGLQQVCKSPVSLYCQIYFLFFLKKFRVGVPLYFFSLLYIKIQTV